VVAVGVVLLALYVADPAVYGVSHGSTALSLTAASSPTRGYAPFDTTLTARVQGGSPPYDVSWSDASGKLGVGMALPHEFAVPGNYTVVATVVDATGSNATASVVLVVVSPYPEASLLIPPATNTVETVTLSVAWTADGSVTACFLAGWGTVDVPVFASCGSAGGLLKTGTGAEVGFASDPDDPEATPVLFQSVTSGVGIHLDWWYNDTTTTYLSGSSDLTTAVAPL